MNNQSHVLNSNLSLCICSADFSPLHSCLALFHQKSAELAASAFCTFLIFMYNIFNTYEFHALTIFAYYSFIRIVKLYLFLISAIKGFSINFALKWHYSNRIWAAFSSFVAVVSYFKLCVVFVDLPGFFLSVCLSAILMFVSVNAHNQKMESLEFIKY